jgi:hypothetical protein
MSSSIKEAVDIIINKRVFSFENYDDYRIDKVKENLWRLGIDFAVTSRDSFRFLIIAEGHDDFETTKKKNLTSRDVANHCMVTEDILFDKGYSDLAKYTKLTDQEELRSIHNSLLTFMTKGPYKGVVNYMEALELFCTHHTKIKGIHSGLILDESYKSAH